MRDPKRVPVRDRLLSAADELFYVEGIQTVGVDRVIETAGVAKASLYRSFSGKDDLVAAYLGARHRRNLEQLRAAVASVEDPAARVLEVFVLQAEWMAGPEYQGCPFTRAAAEAPAGGIVQAAVAAYRDDVRALLLGLVIGAGVDHPALITVQLELLFHGAPILIDTETRSALAAATRAAAAALLAAAPPPPNPEQETHAPLRA